MAQYLISFNDGDMTFPDEDLPAVAMDARAVVQKAKDAGVFVFAGGLGDPREASVVATDGIVTDGPKLATKDFIGGFTVVDGPPGRRLLSGLQRSRLPVGVPKRFANSCQPLPADSRVAFEGRRGCL